MASITASPLLRPARVTSPAPAVVPAEDDHQPSNDVPGPDERTLARTTVVVVTSIALLVGLAVGFAYGAATVLDGVIGWFAS